MKLGQSHRKHVTQGQWESAGCRGSHLEAPRKGSSRGVTRSTPRGTWTVGDVGHVGGGCHSETTHACHPQVGLAEVGGTRETPPGR